MEMSKIDDAIAILKRTGHTKMIEDAILALERLNSDFDRVLVLYESCRRRMSAEGGTHHG